MYRYILHRLPAISLEISNMYLLIVWLCLEEYDAVLNTSVR